MHPNVSVRSKRARSDKSRQTRRRELKIVVPNLEARVHRDRVRPALLEVCQERLF